MQVKAVLPLVTAILVTLIVILTNNPLLLPVSLQGEVAKIFKIEIVCYIKNFILVIYSLSKKSLLITH